MFESYRERGFQPSNEDVATVTDMLRESTNLVQEKPLLNGGKKHRKQHDALHNPTSATQLAGVGSSYAKTTDIHPALQLVADVATNSGVCGAH